MPKKVISQFISMLKHEESDVLCSLILKSIYTFMRDWTSVIVRNNLSLDRTNSCFDTALTLIKEIINSRPLKEKIKFLTKVIIIKAKTIKPLNENAKGSYTIMLITDFLYLQWVH